MNKKPKAFFTILMIVFVAIILQMQTFSLLAQTSNAGKCNPVDLVILLDESESMYINSDVNGRRFDAVDTVIDYLGRHAIFLCREEGIQHRVSVIGFGDVADAAVEGDDNPYQQDVQTYLESTLIPNEIIFGKSLIETREIWEPQRDAIILFNGEETQQLGATDHRSAFEAASDVLSQWKSEPLGSASQTRRQVIMLLTDGGTCVRNRNCYPGGDTDSLLGEATVLMDELEDMLERDGDLFPFYSPSDPESVFVTAVFLSRNLNGDSFGTARRWQDVALDHGGDLYPVTSSTSLVATINDALDPVSGSGREPIACGYPKWVWPYFDDVVIFSAYPLVENPSEQAVVLITTYDPDDGTSSLYGIVGGVPITGAINIDNMEYDSYRGNESYVFNSPIPGKYQVYVGDVDDCTDALSLKLDTASIYASVTSPEANLVLPTVADGDNISEHVNSKFVLYVEDKNGEPLVENDDYPLIVTAVVQNSEHDYEEVYKLDPVGDGYYESSSIKTPYSGRYSWDVKITVHHPAPDGQIPDGEDVTKDIVPENSGGNFIASPVNILTFAIDQPADGVRVPLNRVDGVTQIPIPLDVAVTVTSSNGKDITDILGNWDNLFEAELGDGTNSLGIIDLHLDPANKNRFIGQFSNGSIDNLYKSGDQVVKVTTDWGGIDNYNQLTYATALNSAAVTISQYEVRPLTLELVPPEEALLHQQDTLLNMFLKRNQLQPFEISIRVIDSLDGEPQSLNTVLSSLDGFEVMVEIPSGLTQTIKLTENNNESDQLLVGSGGTGLDESGEYTLSIRVAGDQLQDEYDWAETAYEATFIREDVTYTRRSTWTIVQIIIAIILAAILFAFIYTFSGGPSGSLVIIDSGTEKELIPHLKLRKGKRVNKFKKSVFKQVGIERIVARKGYGNLVSVVVKQADGLEAPLGEMEPGQIYSVGNADIRYDNANVPSPSYDDFE